MYNAYSSTFTSCPSHVFILNPVTHYQVFTSVITVMFDSSLSYLRCICLPWELCVYLVQHVSTPFPSVRTVCICCVMLRYSAPIKKVKSPCVTKHHVIEMYWGNGGIAPRILDLGTRWRWVVSYTPLPLYSQGQSPLYPLVRRLGGPQRRSGHGGEETNPPVPAGNRTL
jgi:hypothetical protein